VERKRLITRHQRREQRSCRRGRCRHSENREPPTATGSQHVRSNTIIISSIGGSIYCCEMIFIFVAVCTITRSTVLVQYGIVYIRLPDTYAGPTPYTVPGTWYPVRTGYSYRPIVNSLGPSGKDDTPTWYLVPGYCASRMQNLIRTFLQNALLKNYSTISKHC